MNAGGVRVDEVVSPSALWVGNGQGQRLFVVYDGTAAPPNLTAGDTVSFSGVVRVLPVDYASRFGISPTQGGTELQSQGEYIEALTLTIGTG